MNLRRFMCSPETETCLYHRVAGNVALCITVNLAANVSCGSWLCENEIGFGRSAERKTNFFVFLPSASPQSPKFRVRLYRVEFLHSQGQFRPDLASLARRSMSASP